MHEISIRRVIPRTKPPSRTNIYVRESKNNSLESDITYHKCHYPNISQQMSSRKSIPYQNTAFSAGMREPTSVKPHVKSITLRTRTAVCKLSSEHGFRAVRILQVRKWDRSREVRTHLDPHALRAPCVRPACGKELQEQ